MTDIESEDIDRAWWKESFVYQLYPQSFNDSDGDGIGDIRGVLERIDYLDDLGVDIIWVNPLYESPHVDDGYDISDYRAIREEYGSMETFDELLSALHDRDMYLVMDLVVNHTSDQHCWFRRSRAGEEEYADYYWWHPGTTDGEPPNNWGSAFGGSAWSWDDTRDAYYLHLFDESQPDLNWETEAVRESVYEMVNWWLEKGIDGFRMDVFNLVSKPPELPDGDPAEGWVGSEHFVDGPKIHEYVGELVDRTVSNYDALTIGEAVDASPAEASAYCGPSGDGLDMIFHFEHMTLDFDDEEGWWVVDPWTLEELREVMTRWQRALTDDGAWNAIFLGNHDFPRMVSRWGSDGEYRRESAKLLATILFTLRGTPFLYQGDEIGMTNYPWSSLDELRDADATNRIESRLETGEIDSFDEVRELVRYRCRDNARTPMQWTGDEPNAGFTDGEPWIGVNPNYKQINVEDARADPDSIWHHVRDLVDLRSDNDLLVYGDYHLLTPDHETVWAYLRSLDDECALVVTHWGEGNTQIDLEPAVERTAQTASDGEPTLRLGNYDDAEPDTDLSSLELRPYEARLYEL